ncbi:hypothetical protein BDR26DRAFT_633636 [Obelidium mucronatum]|nr:hypothetical protein BDR26DRAFT_633636 [Obelidium mucronatum]
MASNQNNPSTGGAEPQQPLDRAAIRAAQNREAQRNFRLRKEARIKELEEIVRRSTTLAVAPSPREQQLLARIAELESENSRLRAQPYHHHHHPYVNHTQHVYHSYSQPVYHPYAYYPPPPPPPQLIHPYQQTHYSNTVPPPPMYSQTANPDYSSQNLPSLWNQYPVATPTLSNSLGLWPNIEAAEATLRSIPSLYNNPDVDLLCTLFKVFIFIFYLVEGGCSFYKLSLFLVKKKGTEQRDKRGGCWRCIFGAAKMQKPCFGFVSIS